MTPAVSMCSEPDGEERGINVNKLIKDIPEGVPDVSEAIQSKQRTR